MARRWIEVLANVFFWVFTAKVITDNFSIVQIEHLIDNGQETFNVIRSNELMIKLLVCIFISLVIFYINLYLFTRYNKDKPLLRILFLSLSLLLVSISFLFLLIEIKVLPETPRIQASLIWGISIFYFAISVAYGIGKAWINAEIQRKNLLVEKKQAELNLLRSQLQPHFLFNTLNNLLSMVDQQQNPKLAGAIDKLSGLLRYVVYEHTDNKVTIQQEIDFIINYSELQQLRFEEEEIKFSLNVKGTHNQQRIEPGIFVPFIENAFKHGTRPEQKSFITIDFDLNSPDKIEFSIENLKGIASDADKNSGTGIAITQERLEMAYPKKFKLEIIDSEKYTVKLELLTDESDHSRR